MGKNVVFKDRDDMLESKKIEKFTNKLDSLLLLKHASLVDFAIWICVMRFPR